MLAAPATGTAHCGEGFLRRRLIVSCGLAWKRLGYPEIPPSPAKQALRHHRNEINRARGVKEA
jgi:hypothetical protein